MDNSETSAKITNILQRPASKNNNVSADTTGGVVSEAARPKTSTGLRGANDGP